MILILLFIQLLCLNQYFCQNSVNNSLIWPQILPKPVENSDFLSIVQILSGSLHRQLNLEQINQLIRNSQNLSEITTTSSNLETTTASEVNSSSTLNSSSTPITELTTSASNQTSESLTTQLAVNASTEENVSSTTPITTSASNATTISSTQMSTTGATTGTTEGLSTGSSGTTEQNSSTESTETTQPIPITTEKSTLSPTIATTTAISIQTLSTEQPISSSVTPTVLPTWEPTAPQSSSTTSIAPIVTTNAGNLQSPTLKNLYPQDMSYSCPSAPNGCKGPTDCLYKNPKNCSTFYHCNDGKQAFLMDCPVGTQWNDKQKICDYPQNANCFPNSV